VVLEQGRIAEIGSHEQLLAAKGVYARLHALSEGTTLEQSFGGSAAPRRRFDGPA
jgi:ABC-type transport system involved in cytochrome bd biosynthesis fused ATPase/permease subunit